MAVAVLSRLGAPRDSVSAPREPVLRLCLLGQMQALTADGVSVLPLGRKTKALLAIVTLSAPRPVQRARLAELLWSRRPAAQARASARQELHRLSEALAPLARPVLRVARDHLALRPDLVWIDVVALLAGASERGEDPSPWPEGQLLDGLDGTDPAFDAWLAHQREHITDRARSLAEAQLSRETRPDVLARLAERLLAIDRTHEGAWRALMRAHAARGERGMAIRAYERCREALSARVQAVPSAETERALAEIRDPGALVLGAAPRHVVPCLGVLPFRPIGAVEPELASGIVEEMTLALACCDGFSVISSDALARSVSDDYDEAALGRSFGIDLLLAGTIQRAGECVRLLLRLLDLRDGYRVVWTRRFVHRGGDVFALQDDIAALTSAELDVVILHLEAERAARCPAACAAPSSLAQRAVPLMLRLERDLFDRAGTFLGEALANAPDYAPAHVWCALWHCLLVSQYWATDARAATARAAGLAERALVLDPGNAWALAIAGLVRDTLERDPRRAMPRLEKALAINQNLALAWALSGLAHAHLGEFDEAARQFDRYKVLTPFHPLAFLLDTGFVLISLLRRDHAGAVALGRHASEVHPGSAAPLVPYLAALGHLGRAQEAAGILRRLLAIAPRFSIQHFHAMSPLTQPADREHFAAGLLLAGVPVGEP